MTEPATEGEVFGEMMHILTLDLTQRQGGLIYALDRLGDDGYRLMLRKMDMEDGVALTKWLARK